MFYTYLWRDASGTPFYIGKGTKRRAWNVTQRSAAFLAIHAAGGCTVEIMDEFILESQAHEHEMLLIERYGRREFGGLLVNRTDGGEGTTGIVFSDTHKARISAGNRGKVRSPEARARVAAAKRGKPGYRHTTESLAKIRLAHIGTKRADHARANMAAAWRENPRRAEHTARQIVANRMAGPRASNQSGFKGVSFAPHRGAYLAAITIDGKQRNLGYYPMAEEAARVYDAAAIEGWGVGNCYLNFPVAAHA